MKLSVSVKQTDSVLGGNRPFALHIKPSLSKMDVTGALFAWLIPLIPITALLFLLGWRDAKQQATKYPSSHLFLLSIQRLGKQFVVVIVVLQLLAWVLPIGPLFCALLIGLASIAIPEARDSWKKIYPLRGALIAAWITGILLAGTMPVSNPVGAENWGEPLFTENTHVSAYPASEQYIWLVDDPELAIVSVSHARLPWTQSTFGSATATLWMVKALEIDKQRLRSSIEALNEQTSLIHFDPDSFELVDLPSEGNHQYYNEEIDLTLTVMRQHVVMDTNLPDFVLADVVTVLLPDWGGEMRMLTVVRAGKTHTDVWAESAVLDWLAEQ